MVHFGISNKNLCAKATIYPAKSFEGRLLRLPDTNVAKDVPYISAQVEEVESPPENSPPVLN